MTIILWGTLVLALVAVAGITEAYMPGLVMARTGVHRAPGGPSIRRTSDRLARDRADAELARRQRRIDRLAVRVERERRRNANALAG